MVMRVKEMMRDVLEKAGNKTLAKKVYTALKGNKVGEAPLTVSIDGNYSIPYSDAYSVEDLKGLVVIKGRAVIIRQG
jgi:hypothetical protein